jgi:hypothetical protein
MPAQFLCRFQSSSHPRDDRENAEAVAIKQFALDHDQERRRSDPEAVLAASYGVRLDVPDCPVKMKAPASTEASKELSQDIII